MAPVRKVSPAVQWDLPLETLEGRVTTLGEWKGRTLLVVNVASQCGFTPQYEGLERLWRTHRHAGLTIMGFPCDQFGNQEPGDAGDIAAFCTQNYDVTFPLFGKIEVNGERTHPLYRWLKQERPGILGTEAIKWNFTKFLVAKDGAVVKRYAPTDTPEGIEGELLAYLTR
jgi:glutathione peroxidase